MSIDQTDIVDFVSTTPDGKITLTISDHHSWGEKWHLHLLQDKINSYLRYIESGDLWDAYPDSEGRELIIETVMKFEPNEEGSSFFEKAKEIISKVGIEFKWRVLQPDNRAKIDYCG